MKKGVKYYVAKGIIGMGMYGVYEGIPCHLIHNVRQRYGEYIDAARCQLLQIELLLQHLDKPDEARSVMNLLLVEPEHPYKQEMLSLAKCMHESMA